MYAKKYKLNFVQVCAMAHPSVAGALDWIPPGSTCFPHTHKKKQPSIQPHVFVSPPQIRGDLDPERLNPWIKVLVLRLLLEKNPLVMWVDADVMFRDMDWDIHEFMSTYFTEGVDMLTAHDMVCFSLRIVSLALGADHFWGVPPTPLPSEAPSPIHVAPLTVPRTLFPTILFCPSCAD